MSRHIRSLFRTCARACRTPLASRTLATTAATDPNILKSPFPDIQIPTDLPLPHYMLDSFKQHGSKVAFVNAATGQEWTFDKLTTSITRVASALRRSGIKKGDVVSLMSPNCPEFLIVYLAVNACGAACSPLNPLYTPGELVHALELAEAKLLVTIPQLLPVVNAAKDRLPTLKGIITFGEAEGCRPFSSLLDDDGTEFPENLDFSPMEDISNLPFSSGTTGTPKGVMLSHYNLVANIMQMSVPNAMEPNPDMVLLGVLPFYHIYALTGVMLYASKHGLKCVTLPKFEPESFLNAISKYKITVMHLVPPIMLFLAKHPIVQKFQLDRLQQMVVAAAPFSVNLADEARAHLKLPDLIIRQGFGMTEASPVTHACPLDNIKIASVGQAITNSVSKVIDVSTGETLGPNKEGELCTKGPMVMLGYLKNPQATAHTIDNDGWLHTGDIVYYDEEGFFYITDRLKELIKYKGFQVAPAELEGILLRHPAVADAAVIGIPDERAGELPRAYVKTKPGAAVSQEDIADFVNGQVASFKQLAGGVEFTDEIPKSAAGKILRRVLKENYLANK